MLLVGTLTEAQCPARTSLFFANGMFNSRRDAERSRDELSKRLSETDSWRKKRTYVAYNYDEGAIYQLLEVYEQKMGDFDIKFWKLFWDWADAPD